METRKNIFCHCLLYLFNTGINSTEARDETCTDYGDTAIIIHTSEVKKWFSHFKYWRKTISDDQIKQKMRNCKNMDVTQEMAKA